MSIGQECCWFLLWAICVKLTQSIPTISISFATPHIGGNGTSEVLTNQLKRSGEVHFYCRYTTEHQVEELQLLQDGKLLAQWKPIEDITFHSDRVECIGNVTQDPGQWNVTLFGLRPSDVESNYTCRIRQRSSEDWLQKVFQFSTEEKSNFYSSSANDLSVFSYEWVSSHAGSQTILLEPADYASAEIIQRHEGDEFTWKCHVQHLTGAVRWRYGTSRAADQSIPIYINQCAITPSSRQVCPFTSGDVTESACIEIGCCWGRGSSGPNCYKRLGCDVPVTHRERCSSVGQAARRPKCVQKHCCYDYHATNGMFCYKPRTNYSLYFKDQEQYLVGDLTQGEFDFHLTGLTLNESGYYTCEVGPAPGHPPLRSVTYQLKVYEKGTNLNITTTTTTQEATPAPLLSPETEFTQTTTTTSTTTTTTYAAHTSTMNLVNSTTSTASPGSIQPSLPSSSSSSPSQQEFADMKEAQATDLSDMNSSSPSTSGSTPTEIPSTTITDTSSPNVTTTASATSTKPTSTAAPMVTSTIVTTTGSEEQTDYGSEVTTDYAENFEALARLQDNSTGNPGDSANNANSALVTLASLLAMLLLGALIILIIYLYKAWTYQDDQDILEGQEIPTVATTPAANETKANATAEQPANNEEAKSKLQDKDQADLKLDEQLQEDYSSAPPSSDEDTDLPHANTHIPHAKTHKYVGLETGKKQPTLLAQVNQEEVKEHRPPPKHVDKRLYKSILTSKGEVLGHVKTAVKAYITDIIAQATEEMRKVKSRPNSPGLSRTPSVQSGRLPGPSSSVERGMNRGPRTFQIYRDASPNQSKEKQAHGAAILGDFSLGSHPGDSQRYGADRSHPDNGHVGLSIGRTKDWNFLASLQQGRPGATPDLVQAPTRVPQHDEQSAQYSTLSGDNADESIENISLLSRDRSLKETSV